jgi:hypothetical protein
LPYKNRLSLNLGNAIDSIEKSHPFGWLFKFGAGAIRSYSHSESTGLVISDTAKLQTFSHSASGFVKLFQKTNRAAPKRSPADSIPETVNDDDYYSAS